VILSLRSRLCKDRLEKTRAPCRASGSGCEGARQRKALPNGSFSVANYSGRWIPAAALNTDSQSSVLPGIEKVNHPPWNTAMKTTRRQKPIAAAVAGAFPFATTLARAQEPLGGQPALGSKPSVPDLEAQVAYQRAFEAVVWAMPASAIYRFRVGSLEVPGGADNVVFAYSGPLTQLTEAITPNTVTPYIVANTDLRKGPTVVEVPAKSDKASLYGQVVDAWQVTLADVGPAGQDKGAGGKYVLIPPGYDKPIPSGYFPIQSGSYRILMAFRSVPAPGATDAEAYAYSKTLKIYPLSQAANPPPTKFVNPIGIPVHALPFYDIRALQDIHDIISVEPVGRAIW
jgi:hypothetical protein